MLNSPKLDKPLGENKTEYYEIRKTELDWSMVEKPELEESYKKHSLSQRNCENSYSRYVWLTPGGNVVTCVCLTIECESMVRLLCMDDVYTGMIA